MPVGTADTQRPARDAERSRAAILDAAEELFAARGFEGASLGEIAAAAGLSRGTPSYFFNSKEELYGAVLDRLFAQRDAATRRAFAPLQRWIDDPGSGTLRSALAKAVSGYTAFLQERPAFARLIQREDLSGGERLRAVSGRSNVMTETFSALRGAGRRQGLRAFAVDDAVLVLVSLTFSPLTQRSTFMPSLGRSLDDPRTRRRHIELVVNQLLHLMSGH